MSHLTYTHTIELDNAYNTTDIAFMGNAINMLFVYFKHFKTDEKTGCVHACLRERKRESENKMSRNYFSDWMKRMEENRLRKGETRNRNGKLLCYCSPKPRKKKNILLSGGICAGFFFWWVFVHMHVFLFVFWICVGGKWILIYARTFSSMSKMLSIHLEPFDVLWINYFGAVKIRGAVKWATISQRSRHSPVKIRCCWWINAIQQSHLDKCEKVCALNKKILTSNQSFWRLPATHPHLKSFQ